MFLHCFRPQQRQLSLLLDAAAAAAANCIFRHVDALYLSECHRDESATRVHAAGTSQLLLGPAGFCPALDSKKQKSIATASGDKKSSTAIHLTSVRTLNEQVRAVAAPRDIRTTSYERFIYKSPLQPTAAEHRTALPNTCRTVYFRCHCK